MMSLPGLRRDEISEFLGQGFDTVLTEESLSVVQEGTGGNPLFLDELARRFVTERRFREVPGGGLEVPEGLKAPIRSRLAALPADAQALVALASVVGREFAFELLVAASGLARDTVLATLGKLAAVRLVDPAGFGLGPYRFAHALVRETIYQAGHVCQASETFRAAASLARELTDPHRLAEAALRVGEVGYGGAYVQAWAFDPAIVELLDEALDALGDQESLLKVRVLARLSTTLCFSPFDSVSRRDSLSRASLELGRRLGDGPTLAYALHARHLAVSSPDNIEHFIAYGFMFRAMQAMLRGEFADAEALAGRSLALGDQVGDGTSGSRTTSRWPCCGRCRDGLRNAPPTANPRYMNSPNL